MARAWRPVKNFILVFLNLVVSLLACYILVFISSPWVYEKGIRYLRLHKIVHYRYISHWLVAFLKFWWCYLVVLKFWRYRKAETGIIYMIHPSPTFNNCAFCHICFWHRYLKLNYRLRDIPPQILQFASLIKKEASLCNHDNITACEKITVTF